MVRIHVAEIFFKKEKSVYSCCMQPAKELTNRPKGESHVSWDFKLRSTGLSINSLLSI
jgi:hypothetical protein